MRRLLAGLAFSVLMLGSASAPSLVCNRPQGEQTGIRCDCPDLGGAILVAPTPPPAPQDCVPGSIRGRS